MTQTVIVTGASRGLGAAAARICARLGANVVVNARSADVLEQVAQEIRDAGGAVRVVVGDISEPDTGRRLVETAVDAFGRLDAVVNNAGILEPVARLEDAQRDAWQTNWEINVLGPLSLIQAALEPLRAAHGRVLNVSSGAALQGYSGWGAYCVAKGALNQLNRVLAAEEEAITAVAFRPGVVDTEMQATIREKGAAGMEPEQHRRFQRLHEEGELLSPETPGRALAVLALHAPAAWSGEFIQWDEARVQDLVAQHDAA